ncbi:MAG: oxidoreductase [Spirochaetota bacterium]
MSAFRVALVTGGSSGIGRSTVEALLDAGATVYAAARRVERMSDLEERGAKVLRLDVTDPASIQEALAQVQAQDGGVDILVNNAGYGSYGAVEDVPLEEARRQFEVNIFGLAELTRETLPHMRDQGYGKVVNVSSMGGKIYTPLGAWYHATKHALEGLSDSMRFELRPFGVDVIIVQPGIIRSEWGGIARESALRFSGETAYGDMTGKVTGVMEGAYTPRSSSPPEVVAETILRAVTARRPRTRYATGKMARLLMATRALLPDRIFDRLVAAAYGIG